MNNKPYTVYTVEKLRKRRFRRVLLFSGIGVIVAILAFGLSWYLWFVFQIEDPDPETVSVVEETLPDAIETPTSTVILVLGVDKHPDNAGEESRSDTVILVNVDPDADYLSILSLPRDLRVEIPGHDVGKLNWAYTFGRSELTVETVQQLTNVDIEEYVEIDFQAFSDMTDSLGGVYLDVDRRYYNDNPEFELIKISPGYQLLGGEDALDYVRFRHDLNYDFGRMDRQQRFLTAAREQAMGWNLAFELPGLVKSLFGNLRTTLGANDIIKLAYWGVGLDGNRIRQVSIIGDVRTIDGQSYVIPAEGAVEEAVRQLLTPPAAVAGQTTAPSISPSATDGASTTTTAVDTSGFITDPSKIPNSRLWHQIAAAAPFQVMAPGYLPEGYAYVDRNPVSGGAYDIEVDGGVEKGIKMVYRLTRWGEVTDQYLGIMQTSWLDAPAASEGRQEVVYKGITYTIVGTSQNTERVWWIRDGVLYWVSNTLTYVLNARELLKVAESMIVIPSGAAY